MQPVIPAVGRVTRVTSIDAGHPPERTCPDQEDKRAGGLRCFGLPSSASLLAALDSQVLTLVISHIKNVGALAGVCEFDRNGRPLSLRDFLTGKIADMDRLLRHSRLPPSKK